MRATSALKIILVYYYAATTTTTATTYYIGRKSKETVEKSKETNPISSKTLIKTNLALRSKVVKMGAFWSIKWSMMKL